MMIYSAATSVLTARGSMNDDLVIEIEDETLEALTRIAESLGFSVEEYARLVIVESVRNDSSPTEVGGAT